MFDILVDAVIKNNVADLKSIIHTNKNLFDKQDEKYKFTLLHWAVLHDSVDCLKWLILNKANVNLKSDKGWAPIHISAIKGRDECLKVLVNNGADIEMKDSRDKTIAHLACSHGHSTILEEYLRQGQNIELRDHMGWTAAHTSVHHGTLDCLKVLIKWGCDIEAVDRDGNNLVHLCCSEGHLDCLKVLCDAANTSIVYTLLALVQNPNDKGQTPKMVSIQNLNNSCVEYLIDYSKSASEQLENSRERDDSLPIFPNGSSNHPSTISDDEKKYQEDTFVGSENQVRKMSTSTKLNPSSEERLRAALEEKDLVIQKLNDYLEFERIRREKIEAQLDEARIYIRNLVITLGDRNGKKESKGRVVAPPKRKKNKIPQNAPSLSDVSSFILSCSPESTENVFQDI